MKKTIIYLLFAIINTSAFAQKDAQAKTILSQVSQKFKAFNLIKTDFTFKLDNPQGGGKQTQNGTLLANAKTGKYKVTLFNAANKTAIDQEIFCDGKTQWTYSVKDKEAQVSTAGKADDELNPAQLFTIYEHGYKYVYTGDEKLNGKPCQVIDLSPESTNKTFFKIRLYIDKLKKQLYSATLFDKGGSHYTYTLNNITPNVKVADDVFTYDKKLHPGVEVVDLR